MYGETLTVTFGSKKYLRVNDKPRTISVRKRVLMLRSNTVLVRTIGPLVVSEKKMKVNRIQNTNSKDVYITRTPVL